MWIVYLEVPEDHMIIIFILTRFMSVHSLNFSFIWCNRNFVNIVLYFTTKIVFCCWTTVNLSTTNSITINNLTNYRSPTIVEHSAHFDNCQARVLVHLQPQSQKSKLKRGQELTLKSKCTTHPPDNFSTSIKGQRSISNLNLHCLNSKRTSKYLPPLPPLPNHTIEDDTGGVKRR